MAIIINALKNVASLIFAALDAAWSAAAVVAPGDVECGNEEVWYEAMQYGSTKAVLFGTYRGYEEPWYGTFMENFPLEDPFIEVPDEPSYDNSVLSYESWEALISEFEPVYDDDVSNKICFEPNTWEDYDVLPKHCNAHLWASGFKKHVDQTRSRASRASALARRRGRLMKRCR